MRNLSLRNKLVLSYLVVVLVSFGLVAFLLDKNLEEKALQDIKSSLLTQAYLIESQITDESIKKYDPSYLDGLLKKLSPKIKSRLTVINKQGRVLADSEKSATETQEMDNHLGRPEVKSALGGEAATEIRYSSTLKIDMMYTAVPIKEGSEVVGVLRLAIPLIDVKKILLSVRNAVLFGIFFALGLAFLLGSLLARVILKPIDKITHISRNFAVGDFSRRILYDSTDELGELSKTLNKMAQDIEDKLAQVTIQNQQLDAIFNSMVEGVIVVDKSSRIVSFNRSIENMFTVSKQIAQGAFFLEAIHNNDISEIINNVLKNGKFISQEITLVLPMHKVLQVNASAILKDNISIGCLLVIHDITEIRRLEKMRSDFVANVSHELKTPLTSIKGFVETLKEGALEDKENSLHFLEIIDKHVERLDSLINDLLQLSHIESGQLKLKITQFELKNLADSVLAGFKSQLKKKSIEVKNELSSGLFIQADRDRLEQVFTNLLDNAIKFNREKGWIKLYNEEADDKLKIVVEDSGVGIPPKDLSRIFERFYRVDKARSRELGGTGLGLSIVKHIVELHGGSVGLESTEGLGSKFYFTLPK